MGLKLVSWLYIIKHSENTPRSNVGPADSQQFYNSDKVTLQSAMYQYMTIYNRALNI
jgi:hypothetical protein